MWFSRGDGSRLGSPSRNCRSGSAARSAAVSCSQSSRGNWKRCLASRSGAAVIEKIVDVPAVGTPARWTAPCSGFGDSRQDTVQPEKHCSRRPKSMPTALIAREPARTEVFVSALSVGLTFVAFPTTALDLPTYAHDGDDIIIAAAGHRARATRCAGHP